MRIESARLGLYSLDQIIFTETAMSRLLGSFEKNATGRRIDEAEQQSEVRAVEWLVENQMF